MILHAYSENKLINPKLNARALKDSPREYFNELTVLMRKGCSNLVIQNDDYVVSMFIRMGLSPVDSRAYIGNGCQKVICRNHLHSRAFVYFSLPRVLLDPLFLTKEALPEG